MFRSAGKRLRLNSRYLQLGGFCGRQLLAQLRVFLFGCRQGLFQLRKFRFVLAGNCGNVRADVALVKAAHSGAEAIIVCHESAS